MSDWWSYRLSDFLLFSPRAYWRLFELQNEAFWPLPLLTLALGFAALALAVLRPRHHGRLVALLLAILWVWLGWSFLWRLYATINWAIISAAPLFALEALLLLIVGSVMDRLSFDQPGFRRISGLALIALALAYPLLAPLFGRPWPAAEVFGTAPDPTAVATLGFLLLVYGRLTNLLVWIPLLWCLTSSVTLWAMNDPQAWVPFAAAVLSAVAVAHAFGTARYRTLRAPGPRSKPLE
jgi:hypothetical protein